MRPKTPEEHAKRLYDSYLSPSHPDVQVQIIIELARARPAYHDEYIEKVARELRRLCK